MMHTTIVESRPDDYVKKICKVCGIVRCLPGDDTCWICMLADERKAEIYDSGIIVEKFRRSNDDK